MTKRQITTNKTRQPVRDGLVKKKKEFDRCVSIVLLPENSVDEDDIEARNKRLNELLLKAKGNLAK